jgi:hypothetical protein
MLRRRFERAIGAAAPFLDAILYAGDRISRVAGRGDIAPEPPRRLARGPAGGRDGIPALPDRPGGARD